MTKGPAPGHTVQSNIEHHKTSARPVCLITRLLCGPMSTTYRHSQANEILLRWAMDSAWHSRLSWVEVIQPILSKTPGVVATTAAGPLPSSPSSAASVSASTTSTTPLVSSTAMDAYLLLSIVLVRLFEGGQIQILTLDDCGGPSRFESLQGRQGTPQT